MASILTLVVISAVGWHVTGILLTMSNTLWTIANKLLPTQAASNVAKMRQQQKEVLRIRKEMTGTSSQDEFAKWAKLRRDHDKKVSELEKLSETTSSQRLKFNGLVSSARWLAFTAIGLFLQFWFRKDPVFWLPKGWLPEPVEWVLSFPQAPMGSISINIWSACAAAFLTLVAQSFQYVFINNSQKYIHSTIT